MQIINSIDLWTEQYKNHYECFNGAFIDGFEKNRNPFVKYKIVKNCNCIITTNLEDINISNKHNAIVFYKGDKPVRLVVINKDTEIEKCINRKEQAIYNGKENRKEIDVGSCDRWKLLYNMLKGSYTEDITPYGNYETDKYEFIPNIQIKYELETDTELFVIEHNCAFINEIRTRIIPIQENSKLTK